MLNPLEYSKVACRETARLCRFWTGHFPHGEFCERFNLPGRRACWCGKQLETRAHILTECPLWIRPTKWRSLSDAQRRVEANQRAEGALPFDPTDEAEMRIEIDRITPDEIAQFLTDNPMVADFEWYETLDRADECARDGNTHSVAHAFAEAHSTRRKAMYQDWVNTPRNTPGWQPWDEIWNATDVAMEILDEWRHRPAEEDTDSVYSLEEQDTAHSDIEYQGEAE